MIVKLAWNWNTLYDGHYCPLTHTCLCMWQSGTVLITVTKMLITVIKMVMRTVWAMVVQWHFNFATLQFSVGNLLFLADRTCLKNCFNCYKIVKIYIVCLLPCWNNQVQCFLYSYIISFQGKENIFTRTWNQEFFGFVTFVLAISLQKHTVLVFTPFWRLYSLQFAETVLTRTRTQDMFWSLDIPEFFSLFQSIWSLQQIGRSPLRL
jgi:hypothetical protein